MIDALNIAADEQTCIALYGTWFIYGFLSGLLLGGMEEARAKVAKISKF